MLRLKRPAWTHSRAWGWFIAILSVIMPVLSIVYWLRGGDALIAWLLVAPFALCWPGSIIRMIEGTERRSDRSDTPTGRHKP